MKHSNRPTITVTPIGAAVFWLAVGAIPAALFLKSGPVLILGGLGLAMLGMARFLAGFQLKNLELKRGLPTRVFPGKTFEIITMACNRRTLLPAREIRLRDHLAGRHGNGSEIECLAPGSELQLRYPAKAFHRGRLRLDGYEISSRWPFGFFEASTGGRFTPLRPGDESMLVVPKPVMPFYLTQILRQIELEAVLFSELTPDDPTEFRALREFRPGDNLRDIHWPASSRSESLIVRESDPPTPKPRRYGLFLHQYVPPGEMYQPDRFEKMLRIACGLLVRFWQNQLPVVVRIEFAGRRWFSIPEEAPYHAALDALAEVLSCPASSLHYLDEDWDAFENCDQVFVLGDWKREAWQGKTEDKHGSVICLDPTSGMARKRAARVLKPGPKLEKRS